MKNGLTRWTTISLMPPHSFPWLDCWQGVHRRRPKRWKSNLKAKRSAIGRSLKTTARWKPVLFNNVLYSLGLFYENICIYHTHCVHFLLSGCTGEPSEQDIYTAMNKVVEQTNAIVKSIAGKDVPKDALRELKSVKSMTAWKYRIKAINAM